MVEQTEGSSEFLNLVRQRGRGGLKLYIGSFAGVGKTYRMLKEAHQLRERGVDVVVGFVETHGREETEAQIGDLEVISHNRIDYRGVVLEEMDVNAVKARQPQVALVDELAHTNVPGSRHRKRWEDVLELLDAGINVISAVNVQHLESLNETIAKTLGITVRETVPDWVVAQADQLILIDIPAEDLRRRLVEGKIYAADKVLAALHNFFTPENLTTLRELALREAAGQVDRLRERMVWREGAPVPKSPDRILVAMSSAPPRTAILLEKGSRLAGRLNADWYCVYVQTPGESTTRIDAAIQRQLVDNIQLAQTMGAEIVKLEGDDIAEAILRFAREKGVAMIIVGRTQRPGWYRLLKGSVIDGLIEGADGLDIMVVSFAPEERR